MSFIITTNGTYLGEIMDNEKEVLVVFPDFKIEEYQNVEFLLRKENQEVLSKEIATPLAGKSEKFPGYQKPISISESTWKTIEKSGGTRPSPFVINNSTTRIFVKPESRVLTGPGQMLDHKTPIALTPGECIYGCIDGVNTLQQGTKVFKLVDGVKVAILAEGVVKVSHYKNPISRIGQWWRGGWKDQRMRSSWVALSAAFAEEGDATRS